MEYPTPVIKRTRRPPAWRSAFTLLEALIASVILAILVLGVCATLTSAYEQSDAVRITGANVMLARQLVDEMTSKPMGGSSVSLGTGSGSRSSFSYVKSYNNYTDTSTAVPLLEGGSTDVTGSDKYTRTVTVATNARPSIDTAWPVTKGEFAIATVTVTAPDGQIISVPTFVANYPIQR